MQDIPYLFEIQRTGTNSIVYGIFAAPGGGGRR
jgi:hypothetical protein